MSSKKVSISRKWLKPVPVKNGKKMSASDWPKYRKHCWVVRWYETNGKRRGKLFDKKRKRLLSSFLGENKILQKITPREA